MTKEGNGASNQIPPFRHSIYYDIFNLKLRIADTLNESRASGVTWTWISDTATYGTVGFEVYVTSDSSKKIFLPAAGRWSGVLGNAGNGGRYWSSKYDLSDDACYLDFGDGSQDWLNDYRYYGLSVRPVHN